MEPEETIYVTTETVGCDGGGGPLGHPMVYLHLNNQGQVTCPYCSRHYMLKEGASLAAGH